MHILNLHMKMIKLQWLTNLMRKRFPLCSGHYLSTKVQRRKIRDPTKKLWAAKAHGSPCGERAAPRAPVAQIAQEANNSS